MNLKYHAAPMKGYEVQLVPLVKKRSQKTIGKPQHNRVSLEKNVSLLKAFNTFINVHITVLKFQEALKTNISLVIVAFFCYL